MLPIELLVEIARVADKGTAGKLRSLCRAYRDAIDTDKSLPWHTEMLHDKISSAYDNFWQIMSYLQFHADIVQAAPKYSAPFHLPLAGRDLHYDHLRLVDTMLRNIEVNITPDRLYELQDLTCVTRLYVTTHLYTSIARLPNLPNLKSLCVVDNQILELPTGLTQLEINCLEELPQIPARVTFTLQKLTLTVRQRVPAIRENIKAIMDAAPHLADLELSIYECEKLLSEDWRKYKQLKRLYLLKAGWKGEILPLPTTIETLKVSLWRYGALKRTARIDFSTYKGLRTLELIAVGLRAVGRIGWPERLRHLVLATNGITSLRGACFPPTLRTLNLKHNYLAAPVQIPGVQVFQ